LLSEREADHAVVNCHWTGFTGRNAHKQVLINLGVSRRKS
jgi:hypothetical protein